MKHRRLVVLFLFCFGIVSTAAIAGSGIGSILSVMRSAPAAVNGSTATSAVMSALEEQPQVKSDQSPAGAGNEDGTATSVTKLIAACPSELANTNPSGDRFVQQLIFVNNLDSANALCLFPIDTSNISDPLSDESCDLIDDWQCYSLTVNGAGTDDAGQGILIKAGTAREIRIDGTQKACIAGVTAGQAYQIECVARKGG